MSDSRAPHTEVPPEPAASPAAAAGRGGPWRWLSRHPYVVAAVLVFVAIVICRWDNFVEVDEELYLLGSRRIVDPGFLALDFTWARLPPTSALYDHLIAPLWRFLDEFAIINLGRFVFWSLMGWSSAFLARTLRIPAWSLVVAFPIWLLWGETLATCGSPIEGFQVKSLAYPLIFFAIAFTIRRQAARAGAAAGLATAFHIIVGGWACLALFMSMLVNRRHFPLRRLGAYLLATVPFIVPLLLSVAMFHVGHVAAGEGAKMDEIYVQFAMPHCCDVDYIMLSRITPLGWVRAALIFEIALIVILAWPHRRGAKILAAFVASLVLFWITGVVARRLDLYGVLKLYPLQLGNGLAPLFLFIFVLAWIGIGRAPRRLGWPVWSLVLAGTIWLVVDAEVPRALIQQPEVFLNEARNASLVSPTDFDEPLFAWIRGNTPKNSVFISPFVRGFWSYAERAQVASMRHPPLDRRIIEWKERLEALNGFRPFVKKGFETAPELEIHEAGLSIGDLIRIRDTYGATHYLVVGAREDLRPLLVYSTDFPVALNPRRYSVYDIRALTGD